MVDRDKDNASALQHLRKAIVLGCPEAKYLFGNSLIKGERGLQKNMPEATRLILQSALSGFSAAWVHVFDAIDDVVVEVEDLLLIKVVVGPLGALTVSMSGGDSESGLLGHEDGAYLRALSEG